MLVTIIVVFDITLLSILYTTTLSSGLWVVLTVQLEIKIHATLYAAAPFELH